MAYSRNRPGHSCSAFSGRALSKSTGLCCDGLCSQAISAAVVPASGVTPAFVIFLLLVLAIGASSAVIAATASDPASSSISLLSSSSIAGVTILYGGEKNETIRYMMEEPLSSGVPQGQFHPHGSAGRMADMAESSEEESGDVGDQRRTAAPSALGVKRRRRGLQPGGRRAEHAAHSSATAPTQVAHLEWTPLQLAYMARAEHMRRAGLGAAAKRLVARTCTLPTEFSVADSGVAAGLQLHRWYQSFTGAPWDGQVDTLRRARRNCNHMARELSVSNASEEEVVYRGSMRTSALLVEVLQGDEADVQAEVAPWPSTFDAGHLEWQDPNGRACCFCKALLLPGEAKAAPGTIGMQCGKSCCHEG
jgi:hypothetical protein